jgi:hypothetical protein
MYTSPRVEIAAAQGSQMSTEGYLQSWKYYHRLLTDGPRPLTLSLGPVVFQFVPEVDRPAMMTR